MNEQTRRIHTLIHLQRPVNLPREPETRVEADRSTRQVKGNTADQRQTNVQNDYTVRRYALPYRTPAA